MRTLRYLPVVALTLIVGACQKGPEGAAGAKDGAAAAKPAPVTVATLDGKTITQDELEGFIRAANGKALNELSPEERQNALDALIRLRLVAAQAEKDGLDKEPQTATNLELARMDLLQRALAEKYLKDKTPTDQELRAEYETQIARQSRSEYRARHILVQTEEFANQLLARIKKGEKFERVASAESLDSSKQQGGDLGWFSPQTMVKPFADAVMGLQKGQMTDKPVQTQYGWHIIRLEDTREVQPPPFEQVRQQLGRVVYEKKFRAYTDELQKAAKIEKKL
jgi:peptidyl-prolyl cis-trans isomerase C